MKVEVSEVEISTKTLVERDVVEIDHTELSEEACCDAMEEFWGSSCNGPFLQHGDIWYVNSDDDRQVQFKKVE